MTKAKKTPINDNKTIINSNAWNNLKKILMSSSSKIMFSMSLMEQCLGYKVSLRKFFDSFDLFMCSLC